MQTTLPQSLVFALVLSVPLGSHAAAQTNPLQSREARVSWDSGLAANPLAVESVVASTVVDVPGAPWVRLAFDQVHLAGDALAGTGARLRLTSILDGAVQELDAIHVAQWQLTSAYFNGEAVLVEIVAPPFAGASRLVIRRMTAGIGLLPPPPTICDTTDDRILSNDPRAGRVMPVGCTAYLIDDCAKCMISAGHCTGANFQVVEFNVPLSLPDGTPQHPPPQDQYAVDSSSVQAQGIGGFGTAGNDWSYFGVFANAGTGFTAAQAQGSTYTLGVPPPVDPTHHIRVTGYGTDTSPQQYSQAQQTAAGPWISQLNYQLNYRTDAQPGTSGAPSIHEPTGVVIGIHTHGGCTSTGGSNIGTATSHAGLQAALASPRGVCGGSILPEGFPPNLLAPGVPEPVQVRVTGPIDPNSVQVNARDGTGAFVAYAMSPTGGGLFSGHLPGYVCGAQVQFYFSAIDTTCGLRTYPLGAPAQHYTAPVATPQLYFADNFQLDLGWSVSNSIGLTAGAWTRGIALAIGPGEPPWDGDLSGMCYLTDTAPTNSDVDGGTTTLTSPVFDLAVPARVSWKWWVGSPTSIGVGDGMLVEISTDPAGSVWQPVRSYPAATNLWKSDFIDVGVEVPGSSTVRFRISASDVDTAHTVEGAFDAFRVDLLACDPTGVVFCTGDGSGTACPCGNTGGAGRGCGHSGNALGARLFAFGRPFVSNDLVTLQADGLPATATTLFFQGTSQVAGGAGAVFGDGLRCAGGTVVRFAPRAAVAGAVAMGHAISGDAPISVTGAVPAGGAVRHYQAWFRNSAVFCTSATFNTTNALTVTWMP